MTPEELKKLDYEPLLSNYKRAIELDSTNNENGKNPFDQEQLLGEILNRYQILERKLKVYSESEDGGMIGEP